VYGFTSCAETTCRSGPSVCPDDAYIVRGVPRYRCRCGGSWVHSGPVAAYARPNSVGAGPAVAQRGGAALFGRGRHVAPYYHGRSVACGRCVVGHGRRFAVSCSWCCDRRDMGRSARARFYGNQAAGVTVRGGRCAMLVDPPCCQPGPECGTGPLAYRLVAVGPASARCRVSGRAALVGQSVPVAPIKAGTMGGQL